MALNRRNFLRATLAGAAVAAGSSAFAACGGKAASTEGCPAEKGSCPNSKAELKISFQEGIAPGANLNEKFDLMEKLGVVGFEPGGRGLKDRVKEIKEALNGRNIKVSAICAGFQGFILSTDPAIRKQCMDTMKEIIAPAGELGSTGVIIVPAFNGQNRLCLIRRKRGISYANNSMKWVTLQKSTGLQLSLNRSTGKKHSIFVR